MKASQRGKASSSRLGRRRRRVGRDSGSMSLRIERATSGTGTKDRRKIDRRRVLRTVGHECSAESQ